MTTEIKKETKITINFDFGTFRWFQTIKVIGTSIVDGREVTIEITPESAKHILSEMQFTAELRYPGVEITIQ